MYKDKFLSFGSAISLFSKFFFFVLCFGSVLLHFQHFFSVFLPFISFFIGSFQFYVNSIRCNCFSSHFNRFNLTIIGTSI